MTINRTKNMRNILETLDFEISEEEISYKATDPERVDRAWEIKNALDAIISKDRSLMGSMWKGFHRVLDDFAPGWDND